MLVERLTFLCWHKREERRRQGYHKLERTNKWYVQRLRVAERAQSVSGGFIERKGVTILHVSVDTTFVINVGWTAIGRRVAIQGRMLVEKGERKKMDFVVLVNVRC